MFISLILAIFVEQSIRSRKDAIRVLLFIPYVTNVVVSSYVWQMVLSQHGPLAHLLNFLHIYDYPIWLGDPFWAMPAIILLGVWRSIGYVFVLYLAGLQNIPMELIEASTLDGASYTQQVFRITIPLLSSTTFFILITQLIFSFRIFAQILILTYGGPGTATSVLAFHIYMTAFMFFKMGYASTITWIMFIIIFGFTLIQWRIQKRWVYYY
jgi:multiple sugar transport system permease protein